MKIDPTGAWKGQYAYSDPAADVGGPFGFGMRVWRNWLGRLHGLGWDDRASPFPLESSITAKVVDDQLTFVKTYQTPWMVDASGNVRTQEAWLSELYGRDQILWLPQHRIHYEGVCDASGRRITGTWSSVGWNMLLKNGSYWRVGDDTSTGTWFAERLDP